MDKMYRVFISSTFNDLQDERKEVIQALLGIDCVPTGMEIFQATDDDQWNLIKKVIRSCDYYIVIVGSRYGSIHPQTGKSYTQMEYEYALQTGIPILGFVYKDIKSLPLNKIDNISKLEAFIKLVEKKMVRFWKTPEDLAKNVLLSLHKVISTHPRPGWIKGDDSKIITQQTSSKNPYPQSINVYNIDYWSSGLMEFANILLGSGITAFSNFFDKKIRAKLPKIEITQTTQVEIRFPNNHYILYNIIKKPFRGIVILCVERKFWVNYIMDFLNNVDGKYQLLYRETQKYSNSGLYELSSMFSGHFATALADIINSQVAIAKGGFLESTLSAENGELSVFSKEAKLFIASQEFCSDCAIFKAYFLTGTSTIDQFFDSTE